jgi:mono/diheme cytochrome c family protein
MTPAGSNLQSRYAKNRPGRQLLLARLLVFGNFLLFPGVVTGQDAAAFFRTNCYSCHTIAGGRLTGPDLKDVTSRKDRPWLLTFILSPKEVLDSGDPYAQQLFKDARGVIMPNVPGINRATAEALLDLIEKESRLEESNFMGLQVSDRPISLQEIETGRRIFRGVQRLSNGGPPCVSCHTVADLGGLGGGRVGPDLTKVFERLGGRRGLSAWLLAPTSPTMSSVFGRHPFNPEEITPVAAFLEDQTKNHSVESPNAQQAALLFGGLLVSGLLLSVLGRFRGRRLSPEEKARQ